MNSITRLILRRVVSGNVTLTPQVLKILKECDQDQPDADAPASAGHADRSPNSANEPATPPDPDNRETPAGEKHLTFVNPLPGRWIRRTECGVGGALLLAASLAQAAFPPGALETANAAFAQGNYSEAARGYESIIARQGFSAPVLFNLANAQQRNGQFGQAILNYERAALLAPNDSDIAANLRLTRQNAGVEGERRSRIQEAAQLLTLNGWFSLAAVAVLLLAAALPLKQIRPQLRLALNLGNVVAALAFALAATAVGIRWPDLHRAVVIAPETAVGVSPVTVAQPVFKLRAGEDVTLKQTHGTFARIENHAGQEGWVKASDVVRVIQ